MKRKLSPHTARRISRAERLRFLLRFAQMDLTRLRPGDWLNLRDDCAKVLVGAEYSQDFDFGFDTDKIPVPDGFLAHPDTPSSPDEFSQEAFRQLQAEMRTILDDMVFGAREEHAPVVPAIPLHVALSMTSMKGLPFLIATGAMRDVVLWLLFMLLQEGAASLARCPECGMIFSRNRNQDYCSRPCTNRVSQRLWQERHAVAVLP